MTDAVAWWGAITGSLATAVAVRREIVISRLRVGVDHRLHMTINRHTRELTGAWLAVRLVNRGGRTASIERVGVEWLHTWQRGAELHIETHPRVAEIALGGALRELEPNRSSQRASTPLGPLLAEGIDPFEHAVWGWAHTANGREWRGPPHPIVLPGVPPPPGLTWEAVREGFARLREDAEKSGQVQLDHRFLIVPLEEPRLERNGDAGDGASG